jgi:hypothetical protein
MDRVADDLALQFELPVFVMSLERLPKQGTVRMTPEMLRFHYRWRFVEALWTLPRVQNFVRQSMRWAWDRLPGKPDKSISVEAIPAESEYVVLLRSFVAETLKCTENGEPSPFVMQALHNLMVSGSQGLQPGLLPMRTSRAGLEIFAHSFGVARIERPDRNDDGEIYVKETQVSSGFGAFSNWDELSKKAHRELDSALALLRSNHEEATADYQGFQTSVLHALKDETLANMARDLMENTNRVPRTSRRRLLTDLGFDVSKNRAKK